MKNIKELSDLVIKQIDEMLLDRSLNYADLSNKIFSRDGIISKLELTHDERQEFMRSIAYEYAHNVVTEHLSKYTKIKCLESYGNIDNLD